MTSERRAVRAPIELWGGVECTVNRVGDRFHDQLVWSGHDERIEDLEAFARLGLRTLRYPILWERTAPDGLESADFSWSDARMERMRALGIRPIVGLVHHGSGPLHTSLLDPSFPEGLAAYARLVAERYPDVTLWNPVNEPVTTARFSGLYGHWYPHVANIRGFIRALLHECRGIVLAMRAVREVIPDALLVPTEDAGAIFGTPKIAYQTAYENQRRWLGYDLLSGRVNRDHPLYRHLLTNGATEEELAFFEEGDGAPDIVGINYYVTSDRFLDTRLERYPRHMHGGNGRHGYVDVEAVRARPEGIVGHASILEQTWARYRKPVAITEVHLGCTREEQLRWLLEAWEGAEEARARGVDVRAVTVWSLLGCTDWDSLVVRPRGHYEPGIYDVRGPAPRPTALAGLVRALAEGAPYEHPAVPGRPWWRRGEGAGAEVPPDTRRPLLVTGKGTLARAFARACDMRDLAHRLLGRADVDIVDETALGALLDELQPWALVNAAGYARVDEAELNEARCMRDNASGAAAVARACAARGIPLVTFSSAFVFDGTKGAPYVESDAVAPINAYGRSKVEAERVVLATHPQALVVRTGPCFSPWSEEGFLVSTLRRIAEGRSVPVAADAVVSPAYLPDLVHTALDLLIDGERGLWHLANRGAVTWAELARRGAELAGLDAGRLVPCGHAELGVRGPRVPAVALASERGELLPTLEHALERFFRDSAFVPEAVGAA